MRVKKNEPLSNLGKRVVRVVEKGTPVTPATFVPEVMRITSSTTSTEEITPQTMKPHSANKGKKKTGLRLSSIWDDTSLAMTRVQDALTVEDLQVLSGMPSNKIVGRHIHKLVQVINLYHLPLRFSSFVWF